MALRCAEASECVLHDYSVWTEACWYARSKRGLEGSAWELRPAQNAGKIVVVDRWLQSMALRGPCLKSARLRDEPDEGDSERFLLCVPQGIDR